jgi:Helix-turn-helix domain
VSVEAISWALNLAPVPCDRRGKPNPACKAVLIGLANHAGPDGKEAFPSEKTLVRYTCLSKRTVQTALDRLEAEGIIRPCDPTVVAAKIKRADRRPQGWDLAMHLIRGDLDEADLAALERQFPGLTARVVALRTESAQVTGRTDHGVQQLHPVTPAGCNHRANGVQRLPERGAAVAPEPSLEPPTEPPAAIAGTREAGPAAAGDRPSPGGAKEFFAHLGPGWPLTSRQRRRLTPAVVAALAAGWAPGALAVFVGANTAGIRNPAAVLAARLSPAELPPPPGQPSARPPWCGAGDCNERTRRLQRTDGADAGRCPRCHPLAAEPAAKAGQALTPAPATQRRHPCPKRRWQHPEHTTA